jgi:hypothetical protein
VGRCAQSGAMSSRCIAGAVLPQAHIARFGFWFGSECYFHVFYLVLDVPFFYPVLDVLTSFSRFCQVFFMFSRNQFFEIFNIFKI